MASPRPTGSDSVQRSDGGAGRFLTRQDATTTYAAVVNPEKYGAVGDGVTDDSAAWQLAADRGGSGSLAIKGVAGKNYLIRNIVLRSNTTVDLTGYTVTYGGAKAQPTTLDGIPLVFTAQGSSGSPLENITIRGGKIVGNRTGTAFAATGASQHDGIEFNYVNHALIDGVHLANIFQDGITLANGPGVIQNCYIVDCGDAAIELRAGSGFIVRGNTISRCRNIVACKPNVNDVTIIGNTGTSYEQGIIAHGVGWRIVGNNIAPTTTPDAQDGATRAAIEVSDQGGGSFTALDCSDLVIVDNVITGRTSHSAVSIFTGGTWALNRVTIQGNTVSTCKKFVDLARSGAGYSISGNIFSITDAALGAIAVTSNVTNVTISGNRGDQLGNGFAVSTDSPGTVITGNQFTGASVAVQLTTNAVGSTVSGNFVSSANNYAVWTTATKTAVGNNRLTSGGTLEALRLAGTDATANGNEIESTGLGIRVASAACTITGNRITAAAGEAVLVSATDAVVTGNRMIGGTQGVRVSANDAVVTGNRISGMTFWGVNVSSGATDTVVIGNNLKGNTSGAFTDAGTTTLEANNRKATGA